MATLGMTAENLLKAWRPKRQARSSRDSRQSFLRERVRERVGVRVRERERVRVGVRVLVLVLVWVSVERCLQISRRFLFTVHPQSKLGMWCSTW